jgi:hypothetical protein
MKWVAWQNVGIDRMACAWLIRRWIDKKAEFVFIPAGSKEIPQKAEPFDIPGYSYSHHRGHCTFYTFLKKHKLDDPILARIASIVDEADIVQEFALEPVAQGLDLICRGLSRISKDDYEAIERGFLIYEALYAELSAENKDKK